MRSHALVGVSAHLTDVFLKVMGRSPKSQLIGKELPCSSAGGNSEIMQSLTTQKFSYRGTKDGSAIAISMDKMIKKIFSYNSDNINFYLDD